jgi:Na+:H+ antiporter, NhaA family
MPLNRPRRANLRPTVLAGLARPVRQFFATEIGGGVVLLVAAVVALVWANAGGSYARLWSTEVAGLDLRHWVNDGLMSFYFLVVGLEIKRELVAGELRDRRRASMPVAAAVGGMAVPALVYLAINAGGRGAAGWGIPMATDIAFALGVVALLGPRLPSTLRLFLLTMAVVDDLGSLVVIAAFYSGAVHWPALGGAAAAVGLVLVLRRMRVGHVLPYLIVGAGLWLAVHQAGLQAATTGALLGLLAPAGRSHRAIERLEELIHPWASYAIAPLFALANAGIPLAGSVLGDAVGSPVSIGVVVARVAGKTVGITAASWLACRFGLGRLPSGATWRHVVGVGCLGGIGFTVALFIAEAAFTDGELHDQAKLGVLAAAVLSSLAAAAVLGVRRPASASPRRGAPPPNEGGGTRR